MGKYNGKSNGQVHKQTDAKRRMLVRNNLACWLPLNYKKLEDIKL